MSQNSRWLKVFIVLLFLCAGGVGIGYLVARSCCCKAKENAPANEISLESEIAGVAGLNNIGNTCFMNAAIQCLVHSLLHCKEVQLLSKQANQPIAGALATLYDTYAAKRNVTSRHMRAFKKALMGHSEALKTMLEGGNQQDSGEFIQKLLDACFASSAVEPAHKFSIDILNWEIFRWQVIDTEMHTAYTVPYYDATRTLNELVNDRQNNEMAQISETGKIFIVIADRNVPNAPKCQAPMKLDNNRIVVADKRFSLYATITHIGDSPQGGHYISRACNDQDGLWYEFDDSNYKQLPKQADILDPACCVLFFRRP